MADFSSCSFPVRVSVMTLNVWGKKLWPERSISLQQLLTSMRSDVILLQEITPEILASIESALPAHSRIRIDHVTTSFRGWENGGSNIFWNDTILEKIDHGHADLDFVDYPDRGLFWARFRVRANPSIMFFVSTVHMPWSGCNEELSTGVNQRIIATSRVCETLRRLTTAGEPCILGGDFNDDFHPVRILNEELGYIDVFESLDLSPSWTHPVRPSDPEEETRPNRTLDWITTCLPFNSRVIAAFTKSVRGRWPPASDHLPVVAVLELNSND